MSRRPTRHAAARGGRQPATARPRFSLRQVPANFAILVALFVLLGLGGGSAFADTLSLLYVRPAALIALVAFLLTPGRADWRLIRAPLVLLVALALLIAIQLVPLPPALWLGLPARAPYAAIAAAAGFTQPWRPISLTPDLTANSLVALIVPLAVLVGFAKLGEAQRRWMVVVLVALCLASAAFGVAQFASGAGSPLYLYKRVNDGFPIGLLANRNHQAALLATMFPALLVWATGPAESRAVARRRLWVALGLGVVTVPVILATGSRAGIALAAVSVVASVLVLPIGRVGGGAARWVRIGVPAFVALLGLLTYLFGRAASIERLNSAAAIEADERFRYAPTIVRIVRETFPVGTGFGSFDPVFRQYQPDSTLKDTYFNHAHNELLELAMTAGLPGLLLLVVLLLWWGMRVGTILRAPPAAPGRGPALLGAITVAILLLASLVDYPLRAPLLSGVFALACGWLCLSRPGGGPGVGANHVA